MRRSFDGLRAAESPELCMMGSMATTTLMSFAEFERLEEGADQIELLKGELIRMPLPQNVHMDICERLFERLKSAVEHLRQAGSSVKLGKVHMERGYYFPGEPGSWLRPDISLTHPRAARRPLLYRRSVDGLRGGF